MTVLQAARDDPALVGALYDLDSRSRRRPGTLPRAAHAPAGSAARRLPLGRVRGGRVPADLLGWAGRARRRLPESGERPRAAAGRRRAALPLRLLPATGRRQWFPARAVRPSAYRRRAADGSAGAGRRAARSSACRFPGRTVRVRAWRAQVGRVPLYLLDTELPENREDDRWITGHLYGGDQDTRIRQELVLGVGGARLLRAVAPPDQQPQVFHMNEGHSAFITLELARERLAQRRRRHARRRRGRECATSLAFTTHTPVAAGHDAFPSDLVEAYFTDYRKELGLHPRGAHARSVGTRSRATRPGKFNMTVLALRGASYRNGVSQLHGRVSRDMWGDVGVGLENLPAADEMDSITNGVHTADLGRPGAGRLLRCAARAVLARGARGPAQLAGDGPGRSRGAVGGADRTARPAAQGGRPARQPRGPARSSAQTSSPTTCSCSASRAVSRPTSGPA